MPLPDERPRQSVANLIGRFEQQQKRQPTSSGPPSRATSATSNNAGDAVKEEQHIAREWPPVKTNGSANGTRSSLSPPSSAATLRGTTTMLVTPASDDGALPERESSSVAPSSESSVAPSTVSSTSEAEGPIIVHDAPAPLAGPAPIPAPAPNPAATPAIKPRASASTSRPSTAPSKLAKTPGSPSKSTSSHGTRPSIAVATTAAARAARSKTPTPRTPSKGTGTRSAPLSLSRSTAANIAAKPPTLSTTPGSRPKTPSSKNAAATAAGAVSGVTASRPPLPTTGLFAPTAASLAKVRNAPPPPLPPSVPRKVDLSRLSKPTAASAGKIRAAAAVVTPTRPSPGRGAVVKRGAGGPSRGVAAARGGAHVRPKKAVATATADPEVAGANGGIEAADYTEVVEAEQPGQESGDSHDESAGHVGQANEDHDHDEDAPRDASTVESDADPVQPQNPTEEEHQDAGEVVPSEQLAPLGEGDADQTVSEPEAEAVLEHEPDAASSGTEPEARLDEVKPRHPVIGTELEDVVSMLQGGLSFPSSTHIEVAGEIPDED